MNATVQSGPFKGARIRIAYKPGRCADFIHCETRIEIGDRYVEGDIDPHRAGGFAHERLCLKCAGVDQ